MPDTVLLLDIRRDDYSFSELSSSWKQIVLELVCPSCSERGCFARHGTYVKYYYAEQIRILRLRCRGCRMTHALMPSFSLPGTSIGTEEAEAYLTARNRGIGRGRARRELEALGVSGEYGNRLEKMLVVAVSRAKALWAEEPASELTELAWIGRPHWVERTAVVVAQPAVAPAVVQFASVSVALPSCDSARPTRSREIEQQPLARATFGANAFH